LIPAFSEIEKRSNGRIHINYFWASSFCKGAEVFDNVNSGLLDIAWIIYGANAGRFPLASIVSLPFMHASASAGGRMFWDLYHEFPEFQKEQEGVKFLAAYTNVMNDMHLTQSVHTLEDLKGVKVAGESEVIVQVLQALGATPVHMQVPDWYEALRRGTIDGYLGGWPAMKSFHWDEFISYNTIGSFSVLEMAMIMSPDTYDSLPSDLQKIIDDVFESNTELQGAANDYILDNIKQEFADKGHEMYVLPPDELARWKDSAGFMHQKWIDDVTAKKGYPGQAIYDRAAELTAKYAATPIKPRDWWPDWAKEFLAK